MTRKRIFLIGPPFPGHLHPLLGIGRGLQNIADIVIVSTPTGVAEAEKAGLHGIPILSHAEQEIWEIAEPGENVRTNPLRMLRQLRGNVKLLSRMAHELKEIFQAELPDLIIADMTVPVAGIVAAELGIPWWTSLPSPCVFETPDGPPAYFGGQSPASTAWRKSIHCLFRILTRTFKKFIWLLFRREFRAIGLTSIYREDGSEAIFSPHLILALGLPDLEFPATYPPHFHLIGPILYTPPGANPAPSFAPHAKAHVLVTLGSHLPHLKATLAAHIQSIARRHPEIEFHFSHGKAGQPFTKKSTNFSEHPFISYENHLPHYDLVVHHGGSGILYHCLRGGIPAVVFPQDYDQFDNAARLTAAGVAVRVRKISCLEAAIIEIFANRKYDKSCQRLKSACQETDALSFIIRQLDKIG